MRSISIQAPKGVPHHIQREQGSGLEPVRKPVADPDDQGGSDEIPYHLIQEGRMEQRAGRAGRPVIAGLTVAYGTAVRVELEPPWQRGGLAVQLLIEPVAKATDRLSHKQRRRNGIRQQRHRIMLMAAPCPCAQCAA